MPRKSANRRSIGDAAAVRQVSKVVSDTTPAGVDHIAIETQATTTNPVLAEHAAEIRLLGKRVVADVIEIGRHLTEAKELVGHGNWLAWLDREFGWTDKTAERFMSVHALAGKFDNLSNLDVPVSGLYLLAEPSTPEQARDEIIERVKTGEALTQSQIKETIEEARAGRRTFMTGTAMCAHAERVLDVYETRPPATRALLKVDSPTGTIWEPACGPCNIVRALRTAGHHVIATDMVDYKCPGALGGV